MLNVDMSGIDTREVTPEGTYTAVCEMAEVKQTKSGTGEYINCRFRIKEGPRNGDLIFTMFNIKNANPQAVQIGLKQLKSFCGAIGIDTNSLTDVNHLLGRPCLVVVKNKTDDYGTKAVISYFKSAPTPKDGFVSDNIPF